MQVSLPMGGGCQNLQKKEHMFKKELMLGELELLNRCLGIEQTFEIFDHNIRTDVWESNRGSKPPIEDCKVFYTIVKVPILL